MLMTLLAQLLFTSSLRAEAHSPIGPKFGNHEYQLTMPSGWEAMPIVHEATIVNADLVVNLDQSQHEYLSPVISTYAAANGLRIHINSGTCGVSNRMLMQRVSI